jgi:ABC-type antimicrobial peptide transport system permease subunit
LAGIAAGTWLSWYAAKIIGGKVQGIDAAILDFSANLGTLALISLALLVTALATGAFAARDILRVDPNALLRNE